MERKITVANNIDVSLSELTETPFLRTLTTPDLLDLVALEWEIKLVRILDDVPSKRNRQVKVQTHLAFLRRMTTSFGILHRLQAVKDINLFRGLPLCLKLLKRFNRTSLNPRETMQLKDLTNMVKNILFDDSTFREPFGETGKRCTCHGSIVPRLGVLPKTGNDIRALIPVKVEPCRH